MKIIIKNRQFNHVPPDGEYLLKTWTDPRNLGQNAKYHVLLTWVEKETGNDKEYLHEMMKKKFLSGHRKRIVLKGKVTYQVRVGSTTKLNIKEFSEYYRKVELFFLEVGVPPIPPFDSLEYQNLYNSYRF